MGVAAFLFFTQPVKSQAPILAPLLTKEDMVAYATQEALEAQISPQEVLFVIQCESSWNPAARGDGGHSRGLVQIHDQYHDIPDEVADNPRFAIDFLVGNLEEGNGAMWTCHRLYENTRP